MKRVIAMLSAFSLLLTLTACRQAEKKFPPETNRSSVQTNAQQETSESAVKGAEGQIYAKPEEATDTTLHSTDDKIKSGIVAKSDNIIGNNDKAALLNQLDRELDELIASINELEDLEDEDLE